MNALDIESALRDNLDVIEKALAEKTDQGLLDILKKNKPAFESGIKSASQSKPKQ